MVRLLNKHISEIFKDKMFEVLVMFKDIEDKPLMKSTYNNIMERMEVDFYAQDKFGTIQHKVLQKQIQELKNNIKGGENIYHIGIWIGDMEKVSGAKESNLIKYLENKFKDFNTVIIYYGKTEV